MLHAQIIAGVCCALALLAPAHATPYIPADGAQVIERLPSRSDPAQREFRRLRTALAAKPTDLALALDLARRYIDQARGDGDPRYLGYAQAVLAPWWDQPQPPLEVRVLRATLWQSTHRFSQALAELDAVLQADHANPQALLTRATILTVQGEYEAAKGSCAKLYALAPELVTLTCLSSIASVSGQGASTYALLNTALKRNADAAPAIKLWVLTLLAEMAVRNSDDAAAEAHFRAALAQSPADSYLLGAYADFLLDRKRPAEAAALLKDSTRVDGLLLRYALALQAQGSPAVAPQIEMLRARFDAAMLRGDTVHQREQARFELQLLNHPQAALKLAQQNWDVQKEPADARIFLEAAAAANDRAAAAPLLNWLKRTGLQDRALAATTTKISGGS